MSAVRSALLGGLLCLYDMFLMSRNGGASVEVPPFALHFVSSSLLLD